MMIKISAKEFLWIYSRTHHLYQYKATENLLNDACAKYIIIFFHDLKRDYPLSLFHEDTLLPVNLKKRASI